MLRSLFITALVSVAWPQQRPPAAIEAISLKREDSGAPVVRGRIGCRRVDPVLFQCDRVNLTTLLSVAYNLNGSQIRGPSWLTTELYTLTARLSVGSTQEQMSRELQTVLGDRFAIATHSESMSGRAYTLTVAKGGVKMKEVAQEEVTKARAGAADGRAATSPSPAPPPLRGPVPSGGVIVGQIGLDGSRSTRGWLSIAQLVQLATSVLRAPVVDQTGLSGTYEVDMAYAVDEFDPGQARLRGVLSSEPGFGQAASSSAAAPSPLPTLAQAMESSLGLQLKSTTLPIQILVVDRANKIPTEN